MAYAPVTSTKFKEHRNYSVVTLDFSFFSNESNALCSHNAIFGLFATFSSAIHFGVPCKN